MVDYRKKIKRRAILFGTLSPYKAANKIIKNLSRENSDMYGVELYEIAYNYYCAVHRKYYSLKLLFYVPTLLLCALGLIFPAALPISAGGLVFWSYMWRKFCIMQADGVKY